MLKRGEALCLVVLREGGVPLYLYKIKVVLLSLFGMKAWDALPQHGSMPLLERGMAKQRWQGVARP